MVTETDIVDSTLRSFEHNRRMAEGKLVSLEARLEQSTSGIFFFRRFGRSKIEREFSSTKQNIDTYLAAEDGLRTGDFGPAVDILTTMADRIDESDWQRTQRIINQVPSLDNILNSPSANAQRMRETAEKLTKLQRE